jgi:hypothetical protein
MGEAMSLTRTLGSLAMGVMVLAVCVEANAQGTSAFRATIDPMTELRSGFEDLAHKQGVPLIVRAASFDITHPDALPETQAEKKDRVDGWEDRLVELLEEQGFTTIDSDDLFRAAGLSEGDFRQAMLKRIPYAMRERAAEHVGREFHALLAQPNFCGAQGAMMALVMGSYPEENVRSDYGNVTFVTMGIAACGDGPRSRAFVSGSHSRVQDGFLRSLKDEE